MVHPAGPAVPCDQIVSRLDFRRISSLPPIPEMSARSVEEPLATPRRAHSMDLSITASISRKSIEERIIRDAIGKNPFMIQAPVFESLCSATGLNKDILLQRLIPIAQTFARPSISGYHVGAAALGRSGNVYLGVNLEFPGFHLGQTVHGEQFAVANARNHGETQLLSLALSAAPCGHCRQFLNELGEDLSLRILTPDQPPQLLSKLLPHPFGPQNLGLTGGLLTASAQVEPLESVSSVAKALEAAYNSYAPYTKSLSGVSITLHDGTIYSGGYMENAAFNPSLSPFQVALVALVAGGSSYQEIDRVVLIESDTSKTLHASFTEAMLKSISPKAKFVLMNWTDLNAP